MRSAPDIALAASKHNVCADRASAGKELQRWYPGGGGLLKVFNFVANVKHRVLFLELNLYETS
jgi:hypothetical protein